MKIKCILSIECKVDGEYDSRYDMQVVDGLSNEILISIPNVFVVNDKCHLLLDTITMEKFEIQKEGKKKEL